MQKTKKKNVTWLSIPPIGEMPCEVHMISSFAPDLTTKSFRGFRLFQKQDGDCTLFLSFFFFFFLSFFFFFFFLSLSLSEHEDEELESCVKEKKHFNLYD